jgi:hypothetical protein
MSVLLCKIHSRRLAAITATTSIEWRWTRMVSSAGSSCSFEDKASDAKSNNNDDDRPFYMAKYPPERILKRLKEVEDLLLQPDCEKFGFKNRGRDVLKDILEDILRKRKEEELSRDPSTSSLKKLKPRNTVFLKEIHASNALNKLIYIRHALYHGVEELHEMSESDLAKSFFGPSTRKKIKYRHAKKILRQLWSYNYSDLLQKYAEMPEPPSTLSVESNNKIEEDIQSTTTSPLVSLPHNLNTDDENKEETKPSDGDPKNHPFLSTKKSESI